MSGAEIGTILGIVTVIIAGIGAYFAAKTNARDQTAARQTAIDRAVITATGPLIADNERLSAELAATKVRNTQLEDRLMEIALGGKRADNHE